MLSSTSFAAIIQDVAYDYASGDNVVAIYPEPVPPGSSSPVTYRVWYSSGGNYSTNAWAPLAVTMQPTVRHYIGNRLGDFRYCAQHSFDMGVNWIPDNAWAGANPAPASVIVSPYIHDLMRGSRTDQPDEENQLGMGPAWFFKYQLFDDSYVHIRIYPSSTTVSAYTGYGFPNTITSTYTVRSIIHKVPRSAEMIGSIWWNTDEWDCRDSAGNVVPNGIYVVSIDAYDKHWRAFDWSDTNPPLTDASSMSKIGRRGWAWFTIPVDILRIMKLYAYPIVDYVGLKSFTYRLTGASRVKVRVYKDAPTFSSVVDSNPTSPTYGEPIPSDPSKLIKTLNFYRPAGNWEEQWDGSDESGNFMPDGVYTFTITAVNDYSRVATDMYGNDRPIMGNITIMRTAPPSNSDTGGTGLTSGSGNIVIGTYAPARGARIPGGVSNVTIGLASGELGITASNSYLKIQSPSGKVINGELAVLEQSVIGRFPTLTEEGAYTVDMKVASLNNRNWWVERYTFSVAKAPVPFADDVYAYPNPAKSSVKFAYPAVGTGKIRIRNVTGDL
ncbi:MAG: FlgD immunoglobulin-like domain containing protein, partial [Endomicrobiia bacterium]|nr:FlgD immunoglobulin-like domain containing protein [Endomicrobiia bacterium]